MIHTDKLTKNFIVKKETVEAVKGVDIDVAPGELVAFLGPNGAGKSTTLRMLTTLLRPTSGTATVAGVDVAADPAGVRARIGYIGQGNGGGHSFRVIDETDHAGPLLRHEHHRCHGPGAGTAEVPGPRRPRQTHRDQALRRPAAADGRGAGADAFAAAAVPRRAVHRHGPAEPGQPLGAHHADAGRARHHHRADHALHGRGGLDVRARHRHRPRTRSSPTTPPPGSRPTSPATCWPSRSRRTPPRRCGGCWAAPPRAAR